MNRSLALREFRSKFFARFDVKYNCAALFGDHGVIVVEDAGILGDGIERNAQ
jgi:hypothetical protein